MKLIMVVGGLLGFGIGIGFCWAAGSPWPSVVWRSALASLLGGWLLRWWGRVWLKSLQQSFAERQKSLKDETTKTTPLPKASRK